MNGEIQSAHEEAIRVVKKQRLCEESTRNSVESLLTRVQELQERIRSGEVQNFEEELRQLKNSVEREEMLKTINKHTRDFHASISKLGKMLEGYFLKDISISTRDIKFHPESLNRVILEHLFKEGRFELCDIFAAEAGITEMVELRENYRKLHAVVHDLKRLNLESALKWAEENRSKISSDGKPSYFEFQIHRLQYLSILRMSGQNEALIYCKKHFPQFTENYFPEIQRLTGHLIYAKHPASKSPYKDNLDQQWDQLVQTFIKQACELLGQAHQSPLLVSVSAGSIVLPELIRLAEVMVSSGKDIKQCAQLPLEVEVGREFQFHSIFACPVSKDQSTSENPPLLMPCGHVLCEQSILRIAKQKNKSVKCPYCPIESVPANCRKLIFPDVIR